MNSEEAELKILREKGEYKKEGIADSDWVMEPTEDGREMSKILQEKSQYEKEKKSLRHRIKDADRRILELQAAYAAIRNRNSPVLQLPEEITRIIFFYTQEYPKGGAFDSLLELQLLPEVVISHVCRQWRLISLAYPFLWTRFRHYATRATRVPLDRFKLYLKRSEPKPLELWFNFRIDDPEIIDCEDQLDLLEMAIDHAQRWKRVVVISDEDCPLLSVFGRLEWVSVPHLEYFAFCTNNKDDPSKYPSNLEPAIFKNGAPKLKSVILDSSIGHCLLPPLQGITTLCLETLCFEYRTMRLEIKEPFPWPTFVEVLSLPSLVNLSVMGPIFEYPEVSIDLIIMKNLVNLRFGETDSSFPLLLPFLEAPLLETLLIKSESLEGLEDDQPAEPFGFPSLKSLSLVEVAISAPAAQYFAKMTESVTDIIISNKEYDESLFFVFLRSCSEYWTNLKVVKLDLDIGCRLNEIIQFAQTRRDSGLVLHVLDDIVSQWLSTLFLGQPYAYAELAKLCRIQKIDIKLSQILTLVWAEHWPTTQWTPDLLLERRDDDPEP